MPGLRSIRSLAKESLRGVEPAEIGKHRPKFEWVDPRTLYVEEAYQRAIADNGIALIHKIYSGFAWNRFKPPICVRLPENGNVLVCIDGQHTATACASHPAIDKIPIMIVDAEDAAKRAKAFVGHNKDRLGLTTVMIYAAELAAGDPLAMMIDQACRKAGANIPRRAISTSHDKHPIGTTISLGAIRAIAKMQGKEALIRVLKLLVAVGRGPIKSTEIAAVALVLAHHPKLDDEKLRRIIVRKTVEQWTAEVHGDSVETGKAIPICVACAWCRLLGVAELNLKSKGHQHDHARLFSKSDKVLAVKREVKPTSAAVIAPPASPPESRPALEPIERDGVRLDLKRRRIVRKGLIVELNDEETAALAALVKVMPAILTNDHIAQKTFGDTRDAAYRVHALIAALQPRLNVIGLKLREVPKMGFALGAAA
jgi:hypothetical protein